MKNKKRLLSGALGATMLLGGCASQVAPAEISEQVAAPEVSGDAVNGLVEAEVKVYDKIANVQGAFAYNQDVITPADEIFNIFGTAVTGICAKPVFELETSKADFYINVGGKINHAYTVNLKDMEDQESSALMLCSCATGAATANADVVGIKLDSILSLAEIDEDVNTVNVIGSDGYQMALPLNYALEKQAMLVYRVNDQEVPSGTQFWVPGTVAKYFIRDVVDIELTAEDEVPEIKQRDEALRAEVAIMNYVESNFYVGDEIAFEGYADDCGDPIVAVEFSLDGGETWTSYETEAVAEKWVYWNFVYKAEVPGEYKLSVRAVTESGNVSPLAANVVFTVEEPVI